ncbi:hypothetical protein BaRGS_00006261, partial [Batillaria attramentaria]
IDKVQPKHGGARCTIEGRVAAKLLTPINCHLAFCQRGEELVGISNTSLALLAC